MQEIKAFLNDDGNAVLTCPECKTAKLVDMSRFKDIDKAVRLSVRCPNGHSYKVILERRLYYRKKVKFTGTYFMKNGSVKGPMTVHDISRTGISFKLWTDINLKMGDRLMVQFQLDDEQRTKILKEVVVRSANGVNIGAQFFSIDPGNVYDKALGFYLM